MRLLSTAFLAGSLFVLPGHARGQQNQIPYSPIEQQHIQALMNVCAETVVTKMLSAERQVRSQGLTMHWMLPLPDGTAVEITRDEALKQMTVACFAWSAPHDPVLARRFRPTHQAPTT